MTTGWGLWAERLRGSGWKINGLWIAIAYFLVGATELMRSGSLIGNYMNRFLAIGSLMCLVAFEGCGARAPSRGTQGRTAKSFASHTANATASTHDSTQFGWDAARSSASGDPTGITAANVAGMRRQQVALDGTVDGAAIYLHGVRIGDAVHDAFFV